MTRPAPWPATAHLFARQRFGMTPGLDRTRELLQRLGRPQSAFDAVLVGGTNGKGTVVAVLDEVLRADGRAVGRFVSPHLIRPGERIRTHGRDVDDARFERLAATVLPHADAVGASFFEVLVAMACLAFAEDDVRIGLFEVGLGGALDATNALDPVLSAITRIARDHTEVLGDTTEKIAHEKAGIMRARTRTWTNAHGPALAALQREAFRRRARLRPLISLDDGLLPLVRARRGALTWTAQETPVGTRFRLDLAGVPREEAHLPLVGRAAAENAALALCLARDLGAGPIAMHLGVANVRWPGRFERVLGRVDPYRGVPIRFDGAHNPDAAAALARILARFGARPPLVLGAAREKEIEAIVAELEVATGPLFVTRATTSPRAETPERIVERLRNAGLHVAGAFDDPREAVAAALTVERSAPEDAPVAARGATGDDPANPFLDDARVVVAGSLYLVGELRAWWTGEPLPGWERWQ